MKTYTISRNILETFNSGYVAFVELSATETLHVLFDADMNVLHATIYEHYIVNGRLVSTTQKLVYTQIEII